MNGNGKNPVAQRDVSKKVGQLDWTKDLQKQSYVRCWKRKPGRTKKAASFPSGGCWVEYEA